MLAEAPSVAYIHEPFNLHHRPGICGAKFDYWFTYISHENEDVFYKHIENTLTFRYNLTSELRTITSRNDARRVLREYIACLRNRISGARPLMKDPIAVLSAEWLAAAFNMEVLVLVRHPAAFASSLKKLNWTHPFSHFLQQTALMRDHLWPFEEELKEYADGEHDIIDQASLLWRLIYYVVSKYQKEHEDWVLLRHEDLSRDPLGGFEELYDRFHLQFSESTRQVIREHSDPSNPSEAPPVSRYLKRDSRANIWNWKKRLRLSEIERIKEQVQDVSGQFYSDSDW